MESSLYRQFSNYSNVYIRKNLLNASRSIKEIFERAWGKNGVEFNELSLKDRKKLNEAIIAFEKILLENAIDNEEAIVHEKMDNKNCKLKTYLKDYFNEKEFPLVLEIIENYKKKNPYYYHILSKLYSKDFNELNTDINIIEKDFLNFQNIVIDIKKQLQDEIRRLNKKDTYSDVIKVKIEMEKKLYLEQESNSNKEQTVSSKKSKKITKENSISKKVKINKDKKNLASGQIKIESLANYFNTTDENISEAVEYLSSDERQCIKLYFGIGMRRFSLKEIKNILKIDEKDIMSYIKNGIIKMSNTVKMIKDRDNQEKVVTKIKVRPKAYKKK